MPSFLEGLGSNDVTASVGTAGGAADAEKVLPAGTTVERALAEGLIDKDGNPVIAELMKPGPLGERAMGKENAPNVVIEYVSLTCPVCREFHEKTFPKFKRAYIDTGKVRFIVREFPIGRTAAAAAVALRCAPENKYFTGVNALLANQSSWVAQELNPDALFKAMAKTGIKRADFDACLTNAAINDGLFWVKSRGRSFGVTGTPTFFVNGQRLGGMQTVESLAQALSAPAATAGKQGQPANQPQAEAGSGRGPAQSSAPQQGGAASQPVAPQKPVQKPS